MHLRVVGGRNLIHLPQTICNDSSPKGSGITTPVLLNFPFYCRTICCYYYDYLLVPSTVTVGFISLSELILPLDLSPEMSLGSVFLFIAYLLPYSNGLRSTLLV